MSADVIESVQSVLASDLQANLLSAQPPYERVIGLLDERDFLRLRRRKFKFAPNCRYDDWLDEREGLYIGLSASGIRTHLVTVSLDDVLAWCRRRSVNVDVFALDQYAAAIIQSVVPSGRFVHRDDMDAAESFYRRN